MDKSASAFGWKEWPFRIVADATFARVWADRAILRNEIERRLRRLKSIPHSTVQIIWADFGAGKSHTLRNLEARCLDDNSGSLIPLYTEVEVGTEGLVDLYRSLINAIPAALLEELGEAATRSSAPPIVSSGARDLTQALRLLVSEDLVGRSLAVEWLQATPGAPHLRTLKTFGLSARIEDDSRVVEIVAELVAMIRKARHNAGVVWLVDEFQRVADVPQRKRDAFAKGVVSLFNSCSMGLHFVLSFSVAQQSTALALIPADLRSRASTFPMLMLPHLGTVDCLDFARDLFEAFRVAPMGDRDHPFTEQALNAVLAELETKSSGAVTPRALMEHLESVLFEVYDTYGEATPVPLTKDTVARAMAAIAGRERGDE